MKFLWKLIGGILAFLCNIVLVPALMALPILSFFTDHINLEELTNLLNTDGLLTQIESNTGVEISFLLHNLDLISSGQLRLILLGTIGGLAVLIFLLRLPSFAGLRRLGISSLFCAVLIGGFGYLMQAKPLLVSLESALNILSDTVMPLISTISSTFVSFAIIYGIAGIALILAYGLLSTIFDKKE